MPKKSLRADFWLPKGLFSNKWCDLSEFESFNYTYFLDNAGSLQDLLKGLEELSPFADDALEVARSMTEQDFCDFKLALVHERKHGESRMPERFSCLLIPDRFIAGQLVAEKFDVPLGAALIRIMEMEAEKS